jgi:predicted 3-demethylubiquinone-9 3-methyltransferase (glyoxalase superfamily)
MPAIKPFLWFDHQAEEAARFYIGIFPNSAIDAITHYTEGGPRPKGSVMTVTFRLDGQEVVALNGGPHFSFSPAVSFLITCATQDELDHYWERLLQGGECQRCGWLKDKYGLSWQVVPAVLPKLLQGGDPERSQRVFSAIMQMDKLDIATLHKAYDG